MSAKGRGSVVVKNENYPTPGWAVQRLMERLEKELPTQGLAGGVPYWLEPCVGEGAIVNAIKGDVAWETWDVRPECNATTTGDAIEIAATLARINYPHFDVAITNPPFSIAMKLLLALQKHCDHLIMLLRLNWLESEERHAQLVGNMPDVYILPNRPPFINGETDATAYAWMHWRREKKAVGTVQLLGLTPYEVRYPPETAELRKEQRKVAAAERAKRKAEKLSPAVQAGVEVGQVPAQEPAPVQDLQKRLDLPADWNGHHEPDDRGPEPAPQMRRVVLLKRPPVAPVGRKVRIQCVPGPHHIDHDGPCAYAASYYDDDTDEWGDPPH